MLNWFDQFLLYLRAELKGLLTIRNSDRKWHLPLMAAMTSGLPLFVAAYFDQMAYGLVAMLGSMVFLYQPATPIAHRFITLIAVSFAMVFCFTLGLIGQIFPFLSFIVLFFMVFSTYIGCRYYQVGPPGVIFLIMAGCIALYIPYDLPDLPTFVGVLALGSMSACMMAVIYGVFFLKPVPSTQASIHNLQLFKKHVAEALIIAFFVVLSLIVAELLQLDRPYWVPISCVAILQGISFHATWTRQIHRIVGTGLGLVVAWCLLSLPMNPWQIALTMTVLNFIIETLIVRNYTFAVIFITPLTIFLAEAGADVQVAVSSLIHARFWDSVLGSIIGAIGGWFLYQEVLKQRIISLLGRLRFFQEVE